MLLEASHLTHNKIHSLTMPYMSLKDLAIPLTLIYRLLLPLSDPTILPHCCPSETARHLTSELSLPVPSGWTTFLSQISGSLSSNLHLTKEALPKHVI